MIALAFVAFLPKGLVDPYVLGHILWTLHCQVRLILGYGVREALCRSVPGGPGIGTDPAERLAEAIA